MWLKKIDKNYYITNISKFYNLKIWKKIKK